MAASTHIPVYTQQPSLAHSHRYVWRGGERNCTEGSRARYAKVHSSQTHIEEAFYKRIRTDLGGQSGLDTTHTVCTVPTRTIRSA